MQFSRSLVDSMILQWRKSGPMSVAHIVDTFLPDKSREVPYAQGTLFCIDPFDLKAIQLHINRHNTPPKFWPVISYYSPLYATFRARAWSICPSSMMSPT
jgi:hypothetical protein